jgi:acetolactate synthase-like protein
MSPGDPALLVLSLSEQLKGYKCPEEWPLMLKDRDEQKEKDNRSV